LAPGAKLEVNQDREPARTFSKAREKSSSVAGLAFSSSVNVEVGKMPSASGYDTRRGAGFQPRRLAPAIASETEGRDETRPGGMAETRRGQRRNSLQAKGAVSSPKPFTVNFRS